MGVAPIAPDRTVLARADQPPVTGTLSVEMLQHGVSLREVQTCFGLRASSEVPKCKVQAMAGVGSRDSGEGRPPGFRRDQGSGIFMKPLNRLRATTSIATSIGRSMPDEHTAKTAPPGATPPTVESAQPTPESRPPNPAFRTPCRRCSASCRSSPMCRPSPGGRRRSVRRTL